MMRMENRLNAHSEVGDLSLGGVLQQGEKPQRGHWLDDSAPCIEAVKQAIRQHGDFSVVLKFERAERQKIRASEWLRRVQDGTLYDLSPHKRNDFIREVFVVTD